MQQQLIDFITHDLLAGEHDGVASDDELLVEGIIDSLGVMRLVSFVEERFAIPVPPQDITIHNFRSVDALVAYLERQGGADAQ